MITLIEGTIRDESVLRKGRPIYLLGEGYGALLAISVAARNPGIDLVLILVDPGLFLYLSTHVLFFFLKNSSSIFSSNSSRPSSPCTTSCVKIRSVDFLDFRALRFQLGNSKSI